MPASVCLLWTRHTTFLYWSATLIVSLGCIVGGGMGLLRLAPFSTIVRHLGYPDYFLTILGVSNLLAAVALLVPGLARVKEWAYAGLLFNYSSAAVSHAAVGDRAWMVLTPLVFAAIALVSWALQPSGTRHAQLAA